MDLVAVVVTVALFCVSMPGVLLTLPLGNKFAVALAHGVVFTLMAYFLDSILDEKNSNKSASLVKFDMVEALQTVALVFVLTPGILLTLPFGNKFTVAAAHGVLYLVIAYFISGMRVNEAFSARRAVVKPSPTWKQGGIRR